MDELYYSETKREVPLSLYKILCSHVIDKSCFKDRDRIDTVKPGTFVGFVDSEGNLININKTNNK